MELRHALNTGTGAHNCVRFKLAVSTRQILFLLRVKVGQRWTYSPAKNY